MEIKIYKPTIAEIELYVGQTKIPTIKYDPDSVVSTIGSLFYSSRTVKSLGISLYTNNHCIIYKSWKDDLKDKINSFYDIDDFWL